jgi:tetratricopeptide (TPR) repeat protein
MSKFSLRFFCLALLLGTSACQTTPPEVAPEPQVSVAPEKGTPQEPEPDPEKDLYMLAIGSAKNGKYRIAIKHFNELIKLNPEFTLAYTNLGLALMQMDELEQAKQAFNAAIKQDKSDAIAYNHLAVIQRQEGLFKAARENYGHAITADPEYANAHLNLGILLDIYFQDFSGALEHYQIFQDLTGKTDERVEKWVLDIERRIETRD